MSELSKTWNRAIKWIRKQLAAHNDTVQLIVNMAVAQVEKNITGPEKKASALVIINEELKKYGITVSPSMLNLLVEQAVQVLEAEKHVADATEGDNGK